MAYHGRKSRTKKKSTGGRRRRRVSGITGNKKLMLIAGAVGGYVLGDNLNDAIKKKLTNADGTSKVDPKIIAAAEVLAGFAVPKYLMKNSAIGQLIGGALMGAGIKEGLKDFGVISGYADVRTIAGARDLRAIAGVSTQQRTAPSLSSMQVISGVTCAGR
jgi:hypothetical protein